MAKKEKVWASEYEEKCTRCASKDFVISSGKDQARYCRNCKNVWGPLTSLELQLMAAKEELVKIKNELDTLKAEKKDIFD